MGTHREAQRTQDWDRILVLQNDFKKLTSVPPNPGKIHTIPDYTRALHPAAFGDIWLEVEHPEIKLPIQISRG